MIYRHKQVGSEIVPPGSNLWALLGKILGQFVESTRYYVLWKVVQSSSQSILAAFFAALSVLYMFCFCQRVP